MPTTIDYRSTLPSTADLVIVGGGIVGAATAFYAARAGLRPVLLERRPALCSFTTAAATGAFRLQFDNQEELALVRRSVELFLNFAEMTGQAAYDPQVRQQGYLWLTTEESMAAWQRDLVARQQEWGQRDIEILDAAAIRERFPYVSPQALQARFRQGDGFLDPRQVAMGLIAASGAAVVTRCDVTGFRTAGGRLAAVETERGTINTGMAVIAAGPLSGLLATTLGIDLPITTIRRQKVVFPELPQVPAWAPMTIDEDTLVHWRPALGGANLIFTDPETPPTPPSDPVPLDDGYVYRLLDPDSPTSAARMSPFWREVWERNTAPWFLQGGQYTMTLDHRPLIGPMPVPGLWLNTGYSGHGVMGGPAGSALLIDLITGAIAAAENPFRLDRTFTPPAHATL
jgi:sarcosine oxidase subunit beta